MWNVECGGRTDCFPEASPLFRLRTKPGFPHLLSVTTRAQLLLVLKGFCIGTADVIPGVSGGTMALILGIYTRLIDAIRSFDAAWLRALIRLDRSTALSRPDFEFAIPLALGIVAALLFFTRVVPIPMFLETHPEVIYGLFFGLIAGSIGALLVESGRPGSREFVLLLVGLASGLVVFNLVPVQTPDEAWFIFLCGALAICAMLLPGISGSFVLLILNKYSYIFGAIGHFRFAVIIPFALGILAGLVLFSRALSWLLHRFERPTMAAITGLLTASLWVLWPFRQHHYESGGDGMRLVASSPRMPDELTVTVLQSLAMISAGLFVVAMLKALAAKHRH
jgi:putative membrane protein